MVDLDARQQEMADATSVRVEHLKTAHQRVALLVRTLTALYFGVGSFVTATLLSLAGAIMFAAEMLTPHRIAVGASMVARVAGVIWLVRAQRAAHQGITNRAATIGRRNQAQVEH